MILGVIEGQISGGYFPDCISDPSVIDPNHLSPTGPGGGEAGEGRVIFVAKAIGISFDVNALFFLEEILRSQLRFIEVCIWVSGVRNL